jgi:hypothetical protein
VPSVSCEPVNAGTHEEMCAKIVDDIKQLADVNAPGRLTEQHGGVAHVFQPTPALLLLNRHAPGWMCRLSSEQPLNRLLVQKFTAARPSGKPSVVTTKLECIRTPHCVSTLLRLNRSRVELARV